MLVMPTDDVLLSAAVNASCGTIAKMMADDFLVTNAKLSELADDTEKLLVAVDAAISQNNLPNDSEWETMQRSWCFLGPGLCRQVEALKEVAALPRLTATSRQTAYVNAALIQTLLTIRRQTLELNDIDVFK